MLALPPTFRRMLESALAREPDAAKRESLRAHYFDVLPRQRAEQLDPSSPGARLVHTRIDWDALPRFTRAVNELARFGGTWPGTVLREARTVAELHARTHFGGAYALLHATPALVAAMLRELGEFRLEAVLDRHFAPLLVHELCHGPRDREALQPPYLDECIAGWLSVRVMREFAFPAPGETNGVYATARLSQVGQLLARAFGEEQVAAAQLGGTSWEAVLPEGLPARLSALAWAEWERDRAPHFLPTRPRPQAWMKLFLLAAAGAPWQGLELDALEALPCTDVPAGPETAMDRDILRDALSTMCLHARVAGGRYLVGLRAPPSPVRIDLERCLVTADPFPDGLDRTPPEYVFPPASAARLRQTGVRRLEVTIPDPADLDAAVATVLGR